jgi:hypothetical protein
VSSSIGLPSSCAPQACARSSSPAATRTSNASIPETRVQSGSTSASWTAPTRKVVYAGYPARAPPRLPQATGTRDAVAPPSTARGTDANQQEATLGVSRRVHQVERVAC